MKRLILLALLLPLSALADSWDGRDKFTHMGVSAVLGFAAVNQWPQNKPLAFGVAMVPGLLKEISDSRGGSGFSTKDLVADAIGAAVGVYVGGIIISRTQGKTTVAYATTF